MEAKDTGKYIHNHNNPTYSCAACIHSEGFRAGIKEVVEWVEIVPPVDALPEGDMKHYAISLEQWEAKLKDWGIK